MIKVGGTHFIDCCCDIGDNEEGFQWFVRILEIQKNRASNSAEHGETFEQLSFIGVGEAINIPTCFPDFLRAPGWKIYFAICGFKKLLCVCNVIYLKIRRRGRNNNWTFHVGCRGGSITDHPGVLIIKHILCDCSTEEGANGGDWIKWTLVIKVSFPFFRIGPQKNSIWDRVHFNAIWMQQSPNDVPIKKTFTETRSATQGQMRSSPIQLGIFFEENGEGFLVWLADQDFVWRITGVMGFQPVIVSPCQTHEW